MHFKDLLTELFDTKVPYEWIRKTPKFAVAEFSIPEIPEDEVYRVSFINLKQGKVVGVTFTYNKKKDDPAQFLTGELGIIGQKPAAKVIGTVINIVKDFMKKNRKAKQINFSAKEKSRIRLYKTLSDKIAKKLNWKINVKTNLTLGDFWIDV